MHRLRYSALNPWKHLCGWGAGTGYITAEIPTDFKIRFHHTLRARTHRTELKEGAPTEAASCLLVQVAPEHVNCASFRNTNRSAVKLSEGKLQTWHCESVWTVIACAQITDRHLTRNLVCSLTAAVITVSQKEKKLRMKLDPNNMTGKPSH